MVRVVVSVWYYCCWPFLVACLLCFGFDWFCLCCVGGHPRPQKSKSTRSPLVRTRRERAELTSTAATVFSLTASVRCAAANSPKWPISARNTHTHPPTTTTPAAPSTNQKKRKKEESLIMTKKNVISAQQQQHPSVRRPLHFCLCCSTAVLVVYRLQSLRLHAGNCGVFKKIFEIFPMYQVDFSHNRQQKHARGADTKNRIGRDHGRSSRSRKLRWQADAKLHHANARLPS